MSNVDEKRPNHLLMDEIEKDFSKFLSSGCEPLEPRDYYDIGLIVQKFSHVDLLCRVILDGLRELSGNPDWKSSGKSQIVQMYDLLPKELEEKGSVEGFDNIIRDVKYFYEYLPTRNILAHEHLVRVKGGKFFFGRSKYQKESKATKGLVHGRDESAYVLLPTAKVSNFAEVIRTPEIVHMSGLLWGASELQSPDPEKISYYRERFSQKQK